MTDIRVQHASGETGAFEGTIEGFGIREARALKELLSRFVKEYGEKPPELEDEAWLSKRFQAELPQLTASEADTLSRETLEEIRCYDRQLRDIQASRARGRTAEEWFAEETEKAAAGMSAATFGQRLSELDTALSGANAQMMRVVTTQDGAVSQQWNLDGFIAEQYHVNTFNAAAAVSGAPFSAEVCTPEAGQGYGKNSFDIVVQDLGGHTLHQYQCKYGADAKATIQMIRRGNYNNQTLLVPPEQVEAVQAAFPGKTVVSQIGGTEKVGVTSQALSKADAKAMQTQAQTSGAVSELNWGSYDARMLAKYVGKQAALSGIQGAALAAGFHLAAKLATEEPIEAEEVVAVALETGADVGVKAAAAGAIKVAAEKGLVAILPPGTPMQIIANMTCVAVENVKILAKVARGELTMREALDLMGCNTVAMVYGLGWSATGAVVGAAALAWVPIVGPLLGGLTGGVIGYMAGSTFGRKIYEGAKSVVDVARKTARTIWGAGKAVVAGLKRKLKQKIFG